jgi:hypothetical protein
MARKQAFAIIMQAAVVAIFATFYAKIFGRMDGKGIYFSQPYVFLVLINLIYDCIHQSKYEINKIVTIALYSLRLSFSCLAINFLLKLDGMVQWRWKELFWPAWLFFALCIGLVFISLSLLATRLCMKMEGKAVDPNEIACLGFLSLNIIGLIITIVLMERYSGATFQTGKMSKSFAGCLWFVSVYSAILLAYFVIAFRKLVQAIYLQQVNDAANRRSRRGLGAPRAERNQIHTQFFLERLHPAVIAQTRIDIFKRKRPVPMLDHPKFLTKTASTLFKVATEPPIPSLTAHKKSSILRKNQRPPSQSAKKAQIKTESLFEQQLANTASRTHKKTVSEYVQVRTNQPSPSTENLSQSVVVDPEAGDHGTPLQMIQKVANDFREENKENRNEANEPMTPRQQHHSEQGQGEIHHSRYSPLTLEHLCQWHPT